MDTKPLPKPPEKPKSTLEWLLGQVESFLVNNPHLTPAGFGNAAVGDTGLVTRLRAGGDVTTRKLDDLIKYMSPSTKEKTNGKQSTQKEARQ